MLLLPFAFPLPLGKRTGKQRLQHFFFPAALLAPDDLRHALVAHIEHRRDIGHRYVFSVRLTNGTIPFLTQFLGFGFQLTLKLAVGLGKGFKLGLRLGCFSFRASDPKIVGPIPASRLARTSISQGEAPK